MEKQNLISDLRQVLILLERESGSENIHTRRKVIAEIYSTFLEIGFWIKTRELDSETKKEISAKLYRVSSDINLMRINKLLRDHVYRRLCENFSVEVSYT